MIGCLLQDTFEEYSRDMIGMVWFSGTSIIVGYLMPNPLYTYIKYIGFGLACFYGISTIVGYLMPNYVDTYILNAYDLVWLGFTEYQPQ